MRKSYHPNKPHFFQPLLPGFLYNFSIPTSFITSLGGKKLLKKDAKKAKLRAKSGRSWDVKLVLSSDDSKPRFKDGWEKFCKDLDLQIGDILVFRHQGSFIFDVLIFAPTACERDYPIFYTNSDTSTSNPNVISPGDEEIKLKEEDNNNVEGNSTLSSEYPFCRTVVTHKSKSYEMPLPREFAKDNGLSQRWCDLELIDEKGHSWEMVLRYYRTKKNGSSYIGKWNVFSKANGLSKGDAVIFELINNGKKPVMRFYKIQ